MTFQTWLLFLLVSFFTITCPGPAIVLAITNGISNQIRTVFFQTLGNLIGLFTIISLVMLSMSNLLTISPEILSTIQYAGATYIMFLGIRQFFSKKPLVIESSNNDRLHHKGSKNAFSEGLVVALINPQTLVFFLALFPNFLDLSSPLIPQYTILTASIMTLSFLSLMSYGFFALKAKLLFKCAKQMKLIQRVLGASMVTLGIGLLTISM